MKHFPLSATVLSASILVGFTTSLILFCSHFHQVDGDKEVGKISPLVRLGTERGAEVVKVAVLMLYALLVAFGLSKTLPLTCIEIRRPSMDFMEKVQKDINASMQAMLIDWLVEVVEEYRLLPETLFLAVNYIDRYLSGNAMARQKLQLLGISCMMIAAKYEEVCAPKVEEFCYITDNTYSKEQVLQMESAVLNFLKFEMTAPTARCFLRRFIIVAQQTCEAPSMQLDYLADYLTELSLLEYDMLKYTPSLIAASATFLAKYTLLPRKKPWNSTLRHYTGYQASELRECVKELRSLYCNGCYDLPANTAIREKYSQHKFKFVAKKYYCPPSIPEEVFRNQTCIL